MIHLDNTNKKEQKNQDPLDKNKESDSTIQGSTNDQKLPKESVNDKKHSTHEYLNIPEIPDPPKKKIKITHSSPGLSTQILNEVKDLENKFIKVVLVNCERCKEVIAVPIPIQIILSSKIPVTPVTFVHKNLNGEDLHCITLYLDSDFDIRRQRISDVVISEKI